MASHLWGCLRDEETMRSKSDFLYSPHSAWHTEGGGIGGLQVKAKKKGRPLLLALGCLLRKYLFLEGVREVKAIFALLYSVSPSMSCPKRVG